MCWPLRVMSAPAAPRRVRTSLPLVVQKLVDAKKLPDPEAHDLATLRCTLEALPPRELDKYCEAQGSHAGATDGETRAERIEKAIVAESLKSCEAVGRGRAARSARSDEVAV